MRDAYEKSDKEPDAMGVGPTRSFDKSVKRPFARPGSILTAVVSLLPNDYRLWVSIDQAFEMSQSHLRHHRPIAEAYIRKLQRDLKG